MSDVFTRPVPQTDAEYEAEATRLLEEVDAILSQMDADSSQSERFTPEARTLTKMETKLDRLTDTVEQLANEFRRYRDKSEADRRILLLEIENRFLRFERGLPPGKSQDETSS